MTEYCAKCNAELYAGQQFCRQCGAPVRPEAGEAPTQLLGNGGETRVAFDPSTTSRLPGQQTDPSMRSPSTAPQQPLAGMTRTSPLPVPQPEKQRVRWIVPFVLGLGLASLGGLILVMMNHEEESPATPAEQVKKVVVVPQVPGLPPEAVEAIRKATAGHENWADFASLMPLDESEAVVTDDETVITKSYPLDADKSFEIRNPNGNLSIQGWDKPSAEVRIVKRGGSEDERRDAHVLLGMKDNRLSIISASGSDGPVEVLYELRLPRQLHELAIDSDESKVRIAAMEGIVAADVKKGELEFIDVLGPVRSKLIKGITKVSYSSKAPDGAQEYSVVHGNVEVDLADKMNTDVKAETMDGDIEADESLGLKMVKTAAGRHVLGRLGNGADALLIKVVNGDIKIAR